MAVTASLRSKKSDSSVVDVTTENVGALTQAPDFDGQLGLAPAPAPHTPSGVEHYAPNRYAAVSGGGLIGDFDESDVRHPTLRIVNGSGELSKTYHQGTLILGEEELLPTPNLKNPDPKHLIRFIPVRIVKQFRENLSQEEVAAGAVPRVVSSVQEVEALGGTTRWIGRERPSWSPSARCVIMIERPEDSQHPGFALEFDGKAFAPAVFYAGGTQYNAFAKVIFNAAQSSLLVPVTDAEGNIVRNPRGYPERRIYLPKCFWTLRVVKKAFENFSVFIPEIRLTRDETGPEVRDFIDNVLLAEETPVE